MLFIKTGYAKAMAELPYEDARRAPIINPAETMRVADRAGSLEVGKDSDVVIRDSDPLIAVGAAYVTVVDGKLVYKAK